ncbi:MULTISPECIES: phage tail tape measure protein [Clostridium]|uniref:phage tail tape measure protein n=1 Tax=Clostridium TaxID=1485 RepID=UPI000826FBD1|nr:MULTISPECIES: phage tail tape measure protein [Clostridium]PJI09982.1 phage tail tape measure protein [Clostridium sp. CT7]
MADQTKKINVQYILNDSGFNDSLKGINANLKLNKSALNEANLGVKAFGESETNLTRVQKSLQETIITAKSKIDLYNQSIEKTSQKLEDNIKKRDQLKVELDEEKAKLEGATQAYGKNSEVTQNSKARVQELTEQYKNADKAVQTNAKSIENLNTKMNNASAESLRYEAQLKKTNETIAKNNNSWLNASKTLESGSKSIKNVGSNIENIGNSMTTKFTLPVVAGLGIAVKSGADFEHQMADIRKELIASGESTSEVDNLMKEMSTDSLQWSGDFGQSTDDINAGLLTMKKDGYSGREAIDDLKISLVTARGANEGLSDVINTLGGSLEAYGMKTNNAAQNTANMSHIADSFAYIANHTKASVTSLGEGISVAGQTLSAMNQPIEITSAALGELASNNIDATTAANSLKAGFVNLTKPTDLMKNAMKEMNLQVFDSKGQMKDLPTIIDTINNHTKNWTEQQRNAAVATIFGKESLASWNALLTKGGDNLRQLSDGAKNSTGEVNRLSDSMKNTPVNQLKELEGSIKALGVAIGEDVLPTLTPLIGDATNTVKAFGNLDEGTKKLILEGAGIVAIGSPILSLTGKIIDGGGKLLGVISKVTGFIGKKTLENSLKSNTSAEKTNTEATAGNTEAKTLNTEAETANSEATIRNTEAKNLNSEAENGKGLGKSTAEREADTLATKENTLAQDASTMAGGKGAKVAEDLGKATAETAEKTAIAGGAVEGLGTAAEASGAGLGIAEGGATVLGAGVAGLAAPIAIAVAAVGALGVAGYKFYKWGTDDAIPTVDLFNNKYQETTKVMNENGQMIDQVQTKTVNFSKSTKDSISQYAKLDDQVTKTMMNVNDNSDKFTQQTKTNVIKNFTDMVKQSKSLDDEMKLNKIKDFTNLVTDTSNLTAENRKAIVSQYQQMLSQVGGISDQQKQKLVNNLKSTLTDSIGITQQNIQQIKSKYDQMTQVVDSSIDKRTSDEVQKLQSLFSKTTSITKNEQDKMIRDIQNGANTRKGVTQAYEDQILAIYKHASDQHRSTSQQENQQIAQISQAMRENAVNNLSSSAIEQKVLLERIKSYHGSITAQEASEVIKNANSARDGAISAANKQYNDVVANAIYERDVTHSLTADQAQKVIDAAGKQRDQSINAAKQQRDGVVNHVKDMGGSAVKQINTDTGNMLTPFQKWQKAVEQIVSDVQSFFKDHPIVAQVVQSGANMLGVGMATSGLTGKHASGTNNFQGYLTTMHERGYEVYAPPQGTKIYNHEASEDMVKKAAHEVAQNVLDGVSGNSTPTVVNMYLDKTLVGRAVADTVSNQIARNSRRGR